jgi:hypothetical protein
MIEKTMSDPEQFRDEIDQLGKANAHYGNFFSARTNIKPGHG